MTGALTARQDLRQTGGSSMALIRRLGGTAQKSAQNRKICGKKDTASIPHRGTSI
jgi:hypothetical protein